jgi:leucyl aminopeptidase
MSISTTQAGLFYTNKPTKNAVSLLLIDKSQWEAQKALLTTKELAQLHSEQFAAELGQYCLMHSPEGALIKVYVGNGAQDDAQALAVAATKLPGEHCYVPQQSLSSYALLSWSLAQYRYSRYKKPTQSPRVLLVNTAQLPALLAEAQAIFLIRDLINTPTNDLGPQQLADQAKAIATHYQAQVEEWVGDELLQANFPAIHAVGRASSAAPRLVSFTWGSVKHPRVTLVGKGVCFDSGGLDLKPSSAMRLMKKDMGGAAQVLGLAQWIMEAKLPIRLQVLIPAVENAIGGDAFRPGDIITMRNGLTVEIDNTDAEGRLVLADALVKACEDSPELLIDFATLTGAARVAVGTEIAAMFTPDDALANALMQQAVPINDPLWRLPLFSGYQPLLESSVADLVNSSPSSYAGAITAALFLQRFVSNLSAWVHFDIMAWNVANKPGKPEGGEAMAVRAIFYYLAQQYKT